MFKKNDLATIPEIKKNLKKKYMFNSTKVLFLTILFAILIIINLVVLIDFLANNNYFGGFVAFIALYLNSSALWNLLNNSNFIE